MFNKIINFLLKKDADRLWFTRHRTRNLGFTWCETYHKKL